MIQDALSQLLDGKDLTREESRDVMDTIMSQAGYFCIRRRNPGKTT